MDGDDAPHAGDDSGKHAVIFAGIQAGAEKTAFQACLTQAKTGPDR